MQFLYFQNAGKLKKILNHILLTLFTYFKSFIALQVCSITTIAIFSNKLICCEIITFQNTVESTI